MNVRVSYILFYLLRLQSPVYFVSLFIYCFAYIQYDVSKLQNSWTNGKKEEIYIPRRHSPSSTQWAMPLQYTTFLSSKFVFVNELNEKKESSKTHKIAMMLQRKGPNKNEQTGKKKKERNTMKLYEKVRLYVVCVPCNNLKLE